ncbi:MAG: ATP-binding protein [Gammaproteobacteria bacterium]|nr:ATP-binding protein [Gammaproteobacteria bacterium]
MKIGSRIRGPRLRTKLLLLALGVLALPYLSYLQLAEMERLLMEGQSHAQLLTAEGISTLFNDREDLFNDLPVSLEDYESLFAHPIEDPVRLDGRVDDWGEVATRMERFGAEDGRDRDGSFSLVLGESGGFLYGFMKILDDTRWYREPSLLRLDNADHVRLSFIRTDGEEGRALITLSRPGVTTAYRMQEDWRYAEGAPAKQIQGHLVETDQGYDVEFRLPLSLLGSRRYFGVAFADVDTPAREVRAITQTLPTADKEGFNLVILRSPELLKVIEGLGYSGSRILVIDPQRRVRAETGAQLIASNPPREADWVYRIGQWIRRVSSTIPDAGTIDEIIDNSLAGGPIALPRTLENGVEVITAANPIVSKDGILGTVLVEQNMDEILAFQYEAIERVMLVSALILLFVFLALFAFSARLAWRIRNLRREAAAAIDEYGRLRTLSLKAEQGAGDEIGDLSRSVSNVLTRLHQHNTFLENMPRTLRHEINNPLNTLSTSLQHLEHESPSAAGKYLASAKRGVMLIGSIVQNLADAANLEESLQAEELEVIDMQQFLERYVANLTTTQKHREIVFRGTSHPVLARIADFRVEQLLDKIIDNAIDFHHPGSPIKVQLDDYGDSLQITVANRGPVLPLIDGEALFESMVSHRGPQSRLHFGLGLYVVRVIAEYHGGSVRAANLADGSGVAIMVRLPRLSSVAANEELQAARSS